MKAVLRFKEIKKFVLPFLNDVVNDEGIKDVFTSHINIIKIISVFYQLDHIIC